MTVPAGGQLFALALRVPRPVRGFALGLAFAYLRRTECPKGRHFNGGNYCGYGCRTQLVADAWREWTVVLADGSAIKVKATNEAHARGLVIYGEISPGQVDLMAIEDERVRVHADNIVSCTAGQVMPGA